MSIDLSDHCPSLESNAFVIYLGFWIELDFGPKSYKSFAIFATNGKKLDGRMAEIDSYNFVQFLCHQ